MLLKNTVCIITGAARQTGIGYATARLFAAHGAKIAIVDIRREETIAAAKAVTGDGNHGYYADISKENECKSAVLRIIADFGAVDVLVNNAGISKPHKFLDITKENYDLMMDINLRGTFNMCHAVIPCMMDKKRGSIINISSVAGQRGGGIFGGAHYAASKAGVLGLTKAIAREFGSIGIRTNAICPSMIETEIFEGQMSEQKRAELRAAVPMGRLGRPEDVAGACLFLASDLAAYVNGAEIDVNGGFHIR